MRITLTSFALISTGSYVAAYGQSNLPINHVRALGMRALHKARSQLIPSRKLDEIDGTDWGEVMADLVPMMCDAIETEEVQEGLDEILEEVEVEGISFTCPEFGCDNPYADVPTLVMECSIDGKVCDYDADSGETFCITDVDVDMSMSLNFVGESLLTMTQCSNYESPSYMVAMGRGCWTITVTIDMDDMIDDIMSGEYDPEIMTEEEATATALEYFEIIGCSGDFKDAGTTCECGLCNEGMGYYATCDDDLALASHGCTTFGNIAADVDAIVGGDSSIESAVPVMKLFPTSEEENVEPGTLEEENVEPGTLEEENVEPGTTEEENVEPGTTDEDVVKVDTKRTVDQPPCLQEATLYEYPGEDPTGGTSDFNEDLQQFVMASKPLYTDLADFETADDCTTLGDGRFLCNSEETVDVVCTALDEGRFLCNIVTTHKVYGSTTATGVVEFEDPDDLFGTNMFVLTGGTDMYAGIKGKITNEYESGVIVHTICIQAPISIAFST